MTTCEQYILDYAASGNIFRAEDIIGSWQRTEISRQSLNAMLAKLVKLGKLQRVSRGRYGDRGIWVRPREMFFSDVERDGYKGPRFAQISKEEALCE